MSSASAAICMVMVALPLPASASLASYGDLAALSFEELANIEITSVSKKKERVADAPASVFVISGADIARSGVTTLPEALRLAPNLQVARIDARTYAVTARGFNGSIANKLLVLIDGRSVYTPLFSGVFWDAQDVMLEDVDRIEVISGAGATLWGANAVNGVINVVTRNAAETQGTLVILGAGEQEKVLALRHGGVMAKKTFVRAYAKHTDSGDTSRADGSSRGDAWHRTLAGVRADGGDPVDGFTLQSDVYSGRQGQAALAEIHISGLSASGQMRRRMANSSDLVVQLMLDHIRRDQPGALDERLTMVDAGVQHSFDLGDTQRLVWGLGHRIARDHVDAGTPGFAFLPGDRTLRWSHVFLQDEFELFPALRATLGWKLEHNSYTGMESLPSARLAWKPSAAHLVWGAASRAVREPSRIDRELYAPVSPALVAGVPQYVVAGGPAFESEVAKVFEIGYRGNVTPTLSFSITAFHADYDRLRTAEPNPGPGAPGSVVVGNGADGRIRGVEMWSTWQVEPRWRLSGGLVSQSARTRFKGESLSPARGRPIADADPRHYWSIRSSLELTERTLLDLVLRRVGRLREPAVPSYEALDLRLGWRVRAGMEVSLTGQNLLDPRHPEFSASTNRSEFERTVFLKLAWQL